jgi:hypothetical protein
VREDGFSNPAVISAMISAIIPPMALFRRKFRLTACATTGG